MGIKHLWSILGPFNERKPLYELQGKTIAVDLSCWICEAQNIPDSEKIMQPRMYLRNLYFRTCYLLLMDVHPVFILEGKAPELKYETISARNAIQFKGNKAKSAESKKPAKGRSRFDFVLKQCQEMLECMGLACLRGKGEAEALCAYLNKDGLVDGCISQDSDCFAYGARIVYRNFSISQQGAYSGTGGAVDVYDIEKAVKHLDFGPNKMIALALMCGSDYCDGISGVGKESVLKLFSIVSDNNILDKLRSWRNNEKLYEEYEKKLQNKNICTNCGHFGKVQNHTRNGCSDCHFKSGCDSSKYKEERLNIKNELNIRSKALQDPDFPNENLISEFLNGKDNVSELNLKWTKPDIIKFVKFTERFLDWEALYAFEKFLPILTRWQVINYQNLGNHTLQPDYIKKIRNPKGIKSYEIIWKDERNYLENLIPVEQLTEVDPVKLMSTLEPCNLIEKAYPNLVATYNQSKIKPKATKRRKAKKPVEEIEDLLKNTSISEPKVKKPRKKTLRQTVCQKNTLESFLNKDERIFEEKIVNHSTPAKSTVNFSFNLEMSNFGDEDDETISDLVNSIINRDLPEVVKRKARLDFEKCALNEIDFEKNSFFISNPTDHDLFEETFNQITGCMDSDEDKNSLSDNDADNDKFDGCNESFEILCPLSERLGLK